MFLITDNKKFAAEIKEFRNKQINVKEEDKKG